MQCSIAIQILPMDAATDEEICSVVDSVIAYIQKSGLDYYVGPFETAIQGDYKACMDVLYGCQLVAEGAGSKKIMCYAKIDYRPEGDLMTTEAKIGKYHQGQDEEQMARKFEVA